MFQALYAIFDNVANVVFNGVIMVMPNDAAASRMFGEVVRKNQEVMTNPADYDLVCFGSMDADKRCLDASWRVILNGATVVAVDEGRNGGAVPLLDKSLGELELLKTE